jgi:hypothetical protein
MKKQSMHKYTCDSLIRTNSAASPSPAIDSKARALFPRRIRSSDEVNRVNREFWAKHSV